MNMLSISVPFPSIEILISFPFSSSIYSSDVNWLPWSELIMSGFPCTKLDKKSNFDLLNPNY